MKNLFLGFNKFDDEQQIVSGYCSTDALDSHGEIITKEAMSDAIATYMEYANIREMHQPSAVGVAKSLSSDGTGHYLEAHIVDPVAWQKVKTGVYKGFSIGGQILKRTKNVINKILLKEISLVDRPANPDCRIELWKMDDSKLENVEKNSLSIVGEISSSLRSLTYLRDYMSESQQSENDSYKNLLEAINCLCNSLEAAAAEAIANERAENAEESAGEDMEGKLDKSEITNEGVDEMDKETMEKFEKMFADSKDLIEKQSEIIKSQSEKIEELAKSAEKNLEDVKRLEEIIAATPKAEKGVAMAIEKSEDGVVVEKKDDDSLDAALKKFHDTNDEMVLFKHALFGQI